MLCSISPASRRLTGLASNPSDGAADWMAPNCPIPEAMAGIPKDGHSRNAWCDLLDQFQPFPAQTVFEHEEAGGVAARPRQLSTKPAPTGSTGSTNTIGTARVTSSNGAVAGVPVADTMTSGASAVVRPRACAGHRHWSLSSERDPHVAAVDRNPVASAPEGMPQTGRVPGSSAVAAEAADGPASGRAVEQAAATGRTTGPARRAINSRRFMDYPS